MYLGSRVSSGGCVIDNINMCMMETRETYVYLDYLWRLDDVSLTVKG